MAALEAAPGSQSEDSGALALPSACDVRDYVLREPSLEAASEACSSQEGLSFPCSSDVDPDTSNPSTQQNDPWAAESFQLDPSVRGHPETGGEDGGLRTSLDRFYEVCGRPQLASGGPLCASACRRLSRKIAELEARGSQAYALRRLQVARVILARDGCAALQRRSRASGFYPPGGGDASPPEQKPTPGLSRDVIRFLLQRNVVENP